MSLDFLKPYKSFQHNQSKSLNDYYKTLFIIWPVTHPISQFSLSFPFIHTALRSIAGTHQEASSPHQGVCRKRFFSLACSPHRQTYHLFTEAFPGALAQITTLVLFPPWHFLSSRPGLFFSLAFNIFYIKCIHLVIVWLEFKLHESRIFCAFLSTVQKSFWYITDTQKYNR